MASRARLPKRVFASLPMLQPSEGRVASLRIERLYGLYSGVVYKIGVPTRRGVHWYFGKQSPWAENEYSALLRVHARAGGRGKMSSVPLPIAYAPECSMLITEWLASDTKLASLVLRAEFCVGG